MRIELEQFVRRLMATPLGAQVVQQQVEAVLERRRELAARKATLRADLQKRFPALTKAKDESARRYEEAEAAIAKATSAYRAAYSALRSAVSSTEAQVRHIDAELRQTTPGLVTAFVEQLDRTIAEVREHGIQAFPIARRAGPWGDKVPGQYSNAEEVRVWHDRAVIVRRRALDEVALLPLDDGSLATALDALRTELGALPGPPAWPGEQASTEDAEREAV
jgi:hypothetical protein